MKILYTTHLFLSRYYGGTEVYTFNVASAMQQRGHEVHVLCCEEFKRGKRNEVTATDDLYKGLKVHRVSLNIRLVDNPVQAEYFNPHVEKHLLGYYSALRPDIVHAHHLSYLSTAAITAAQKLGIKTVFTATDFWMICPNSQLRRWNRTLCHGPDNIADCMRCYTHLSNRAKKYRWIATRLSDGLIKTMIRWSHQPWAEPLWHTRALRALDERAAWNRRICNGVDALITPSRFLERMFIENGLTGKRRLHVPFGILQHSTPEPQRAFRSFPLRIGFIGTVSQHKGLHVLIEAFRQLPSDGRAILKIYGDLEFDPPYGHQIRSMIRDRANIELCGTFEPNAILRVLHEIDALVVPSLWYENTPLVIYNAHAARTPVLCSDLGGMSEVVKDGVNGLTFPVGNTAALREKLQSLLDHPEQVTIFSENIGSVPSIDQNASQLESIYEALLREASGVCSTRVPGAVSLPSIPEAIQR